MRHWIIAIAFMVLPLTAQARCEGVDLVNTMPTLQKDALLDVADKAPFPQGLLWHAAKGDTRITLFGTYHFKHYRTAVHLETLKPHIDAADIVFLEVSNADQKKLAQTMASDPSIMFITEGPTLPDLLGDEDWKTLSVALGERGFPSFFAAKFKPVWAAMMLGISPCQIREGALNGSGIDAQIGEYANSKNIENRSLEDFRTVMKLLDDIPQPDQIDMIRLFFAGLSDAEDLSYTTQELYLAQQTSLLWEFSRLLSIQDGGAEAVQDFEQFEDLLLTQRNADWIEVLTDSNVTGEVFLAAGAGHLPGENGILKMLQDQGFIITRLPFD